MSEPDPKPNYATFQSVTRQRNALLCLFILAVLGCIFCAYNAQRAATASERSAEGRRLCMQQLQRHSPSSSQLQQRAAQVINRLNSRPSADAGTPLPTAPSP